MATQYATTKAGYDFSIVHPSNADIRFIGSDNSSADNLRVLRVTNNASGSQYVEISLGDWMPNSMKNYTAAFAIVNEEQFPVNISYINISGGQASYMSVWLHGNRSKDVSLESSSAKVCMVNAGSPVFSSGDCAWQLAAGNGNPADMNDSTTAISTPWDETSHVRYSLSDLSAANGTADYVWVQLSINIPIDASETTATGIIFIHFESTTHADSTGSVGFLGIPSWASGPSGAEDDRGFGVAVDGSGNVYITGYHDSGLDFGSGITVADEGNWGVFVAKYI